MPIDLELNFALENQTYFYKTCGSCTQKSNETWNLEIWATIEKKICERKTPDEEVVGPKSLYIQDLRIRGSGIGQIRFSFWSFNFWTRSNFHQKMLKKCKK